MDASLSLQNPHCIMDDDSVISSSSDASSTDSMASSSSDLSEDASSSFTSSTPDQLPVSPLYQMSSLMEQLPFKRGLSKHFQGKSQSFTSLSNVRCLEDLAKPDNPYKKKMKSSKSYAGGLDSHRSYTPNASSRTISKKSSRSSCASLISRRNSLLGNKPPPIPAHRTGSFSNQTPLFV
ncbi:Oxidative stress 3, putative isoform 1 [Cinnamomum micranthum f. kanehirae]|uniref:Oxidative stress 3, putative isoform 1 n=1 Tax=Cinnamomum micranthum f. kanehirae TaxID=337451 RepID=A0A3S3N0L6_9MAGN|nr:Oxidative stress 3, putative isoform 1 [Cinnamomum micranthum f. kanehirae]